MGKVDGQKRMASYLIYTLATENGQAMHITMVLARAKTLAAWAGDTSHSGPLKYSGQSCQQHPIGPYISGSFAIPL